MHTYKLFYSGDSMTDKDRDKLKDMCHEINVLTIAIKAEIDRYDPDTPDLNISNDDLYWEFVGVSSVANEAQGLIRVDSAITEILSGNEVLYRRLSGGVTGGQKEGQKEG